MVNQEPKKRSKQMRDGSPVKVGPWEALRDVLVASINKGQFPFAIVGLIVLTILWRIPSNELVPLVRWMVETMEINAIAGYVLFSVTVFLWFFHAQRMRREFTIQLDAARVINRRGGK